MRLCGGLGYCPDCEKITLLVPFRADSPHRTRVWQWLMRYWKHELPEAELIVCTDDSRPFCKTAALNRGFEKANGDIIVLLDADCYIRGQVIRDCAGKIRSSRRRGIPLWYVPYRRFYRLSETASRQLLASDPADPVRFPDPPAHDDVEQPETASAGHWWGALIQIMPREAFAETGGMDERFRGWGGEDVSFMIATDTLYGKHKTSNNPVCHVWHPTITDPAKGLSRLWEYQQSAGPNDYLAKQYRRARGDAEAMRKAVGRPALTRWLPHEYQTPAGHRGTWRGPGWRPSATPPSPSPARGDDAAAGAEAALVKSVTGTRAAGPGCAAIERGDGHPAVTPAPSRAG
jgi:hypothetical protein